MSESNSTPITGGAGSVEHIVAAVQNIAQGLPFDELAAAQQSLEAAAGAFAHIMEPEGAGGEVQASVAVASKYGAAAVNSLSVAGDNLANYVANITGNAVAEDSGAESMPTMAQVASVPAGDSQRSDAELSIDGKAVIEERRLGETPVIFALAKHTVANAPAIAEALKQCDVILVESEGANDAEDRKATQELYGLITSGILTVENLELVKAAYAKNFGAQLALSLEGTGVAVVPVGMNKDNPNYALVVALKDSITRASTNAYMAEPVDVLRADIRSEFEKAVAANEVQDATTAAQLLKLKEHIVDAKPDATIGVVLGAMHYAVMGVTEPANENPVPLGERLRSLAGAFGEAYIEQCVDLVPSDETIDRIVLGVYGEVLSMGYDGVDELTRKLKDYQLDMVMKRIDELARVDVDTDEKAVSIGAFIRAAVDVYVKGK